MQRRTQEKGLSFCSNLLSLYLPWPDRSSLAVTHSHVGFDLRLLETDALAYLAYSWPPVPQNLPRSSIIWQPEHRDHASIDFLSIRPEAGAATSSNSTICRHASIVALRTNHQPRTSTSKNHPTLICKLQEGSGPEIGRNSSWQLCAPPSNLLPGIDMTKIYASKTRAAMSCRVHSTAFFQQPCTKHRGVNTPKTRISKYP